MKIMKWSLWGIAVVLAVIVVSPAFAKAQTEDPACDGTPSPGQAKHLDKHCPDTTPPETTITAAPTGGYVNTSNLHFEYTVADNNGGQPRAECRLLNLTDWEPCPVDSSGNGSIDYNGLSDNGYIFEVRGIDAAGNVDQSPASSGQVIVDTITPVVTVTYEPPSPTDQLYLEFHYWASESAVAYCSYTFTPVGQSEPTVVKQPEACQSGNEFNPASYHFFVPGDGTATFTVTVKDGGGNTATVSRTIVVDTTP